MPYFLARRRERPVPGRAGRVDLRVIIGKEVFATRAAAAIGARPGTASGDGDDGDDGGEVWEVLEAADQQDAFRQVVERAFPPPAYPYN